MAEVQDNYIETKNILYSPKELDEINASDINFSDTIDAINTVNAVLEFKQKATELQFNNIVSWQIDFDSIKKNDKKDIQESIIQYIKNPSNKNNVLDKYLQYGNNIPDWINKIVEDTYTQEEIWKYELEWYFNTHEIIALWKEIYWENWNGSNISWTSPEVSNMCPWIFFSEWQFTTEFNRRNTERINNNINNIKALNITPLADGISKAWWKLYIDNEEFTVQSFENPNFLDKIYQKLWSNNFVNINELKNLLSPEIKNKWMKSLLENTKDKENTENKESEPITLIDKIQSMELTNIEELTDGEEIQMKNINYIFDIAKRYFIQRISSGENKISNPDTIKKQIAYILGTAKWECHFKNVKEKWSSKKYCWRWFVQLTHDYNYKKFGDISQNSWLTFRDNDWNILSNQDLNLYKNPSNILKSNELAAFILVYGCVNGSFTWKKLDDYINDNKTDLKWARKIIWGISPEKYVNTSNMCLAHIKI